MSFWRRLFGPKGAGAGNNSRIARLVAETNRRVYYAMSASNKDSSGETGMVMHLLAKCLYQKGSVFYRGDLDILLKAFNFTKTCVSKNWILSRGDLVDPEMALVDPERAYEYFRRTFSEKEIRLLEFEVNSRKRAEDPERERLLLDAGYIAGDKMRFTGKGL